MTKEQVLALLAEPGSWTEKCNKVKRAFGGVYPSWWWDVVMRPNVGPPIAPLDQRQAERRRAERRQAVRPAASPRTPQCHGDMRPVYAEGGHQLCWHCTCGRTRPVGQVAEEGLP